MSETATAQTPSLETCIREIAAKAFNAQVYTVYTNTDHLRQRAVKGHYPHLVAVGNVSRRVEIVGLVETPDTLHDEAAAPAALAHPDAAAGGLVPLPAA
ncbi:MAG: hypothetical protein KatS3mg131_0099 [Candidatus Tectimicrobiota bacterium]|nr:MAG: hypothetical protein KatS3mg131_0099 [Candidatus Tectomicrobia bacterium]